MSRQTIGLNAQLLSLAPTYRGAGINQYIYNLLRWLPVVDGSRRYVAFTGEKRARFEGLELRVSRLPTHKPVVRILWEQTVLPAALRREGAALLHAMAFAGPLAAPCPAVVTVFDLSFLRYPQSFRPWNRLYLRVMTKITARRAAGVIAISRHTAEDVTRLLGVPRERISVIYCGRDEAMRPLPPSQVEDFRRRKGLPERFVLFLGTLEPRKNLVRLVEAFARLRQEDVHLVLAGGRGWGYEPVLARIEVLGIGERVLLPGFVPAEEKPFWYNAAEVFVYPSLYEGFGLPPLEAMACGTPVVASDAASIPEVVGDAGILVDATNVDALAEALNRLLNHPQERELLRKKGLRRSKGFSWEKAARETSHLYDLVLS